MLVGRAHGKTRPVGKRKEGHAPKKGYFCCVLYYISCIYIQCYVTSYIVQKRNPSDTESLSSEPTTEQDEDEDAKPPLSPCVSADTESRARRTNPGPRNMERWPGGPSLRLSSPRPRFAAPSGSPSGTTPSQVMAASTDFRAQTTLNILSGERATHRVAVHIQGGYVTDADGRGITPIDMYAYIYIYTDLYITYI